MVFDAIVKFFTETLASVLTLDYVTYIFLGLFIMLVVLVYVKTSNSYEVKALKAIDGINNYLVGNTYINEDNLVAFNKKMKSAPYSIRYQWQNYVLNRDTVPSHYLSRDNCVEKPLKTSSYHEGIKLLNTVTTILSILSFLILLVLNISKISNPSVVSAVSMVLLRASVLPAIMLIVAALYTMFLRARINVITSNLYQSFYDFERNIDKATTTLPDYIDYESLFTKQEIKSGIPLLQEYLDKRDRQQQEELKKAMEREAEHEKYDFDSTGINGALLLERAMKESELFIVNRKRLLSEIEQLKTEYENNRKNFDMATKEVNRKLQATKENLIKFKAQQEQSTNRIETNYIRKQQAEEVRRQQQLEKDLEEAITKFDEAQASIDREIQSRNDEIEENRKYIEEAMKAEFQTFSEKTYKVLYDNVESKLGEQIKAIQESSQEQADKIEELTRQVEDKEQISAELTSTRKQLDELQMSYDLNVELYNQLLSKFRQISPEDIRVQADPELHADVLQSFKKEILDAIKQETVVEKTKTVKASGKDNKEEIKEEKPKAKRTAKKAESETKPEAPATRKRTAKKVEDNVKVTDAEKEKQNEELKKKRAEARKKKKEEEAKKKADALLELQKRIEEENKKLTKQQQELNKVISSTIDVINEEKPTKRRATKSSTNNAEAPVEAKEEVKTEVKENNIEAPVETTEDVKSELQESKTEIPVEAKGLLSMYQHPCRKYPLLPWPCS